MWKAKETHPKDMSLKYWSELEELTEAQDSEDNEEKYVSINKELSEVEASLKDIEDYKT